MGEKITQAELSRRLGHSKPYITKLVKNGVVKVDENKMVDYEAALKSIEDNADPQKAYSRKGYKPPDKIDKLSTEDKEVLLANMDDPNYIKDVLNLSYVDARTRNEQIDILINTVKLQKEQGKLVPIEQVKSDAFEIGKKLREGLLNIPDRICDLLASENDPVRIHKSLTEEIKEVLESISKELNK